MVFIVLITCAVWYYVVHMRPHHRVGGGHVQNITHNHGGIGGFGGTAGPQMSNLQVPPLVRTGGFGAIPVNVRTSSAASSYEQVGILTRTSGPETILPLMGRSVHSSRDSWNFYTVNEHGVKLPLSVKGKSAMSEYGCDNVSNGDTVYVEGFNATFTVTRYDNDTMRYIG